MIKPAILLSALLLSAAVAQGRTCFVAPDGNDANPGTQEQPFATLQHAQASVNPGDTVYLRGGTYHMQESQVAKKEGIFAFIIHLDKGGTREAPIRYEAFKDERPVFDFSQIKPEGLRINAFQVSGSYLHLKGLEVTGVQVTIKTHTQSICFSNEGSHNLFEQLKMHDGQGIGYYSVRGSDNLVLNCDAWNNWDYTSEGGRGGNVDGFGCHIKKGETGNIFRGCRAWFNSDDGYDCINAHEPVTFENCWAMYNGYNAKMDNLGDGNGFKAGGYGATPAERLPSPIPRHTVRFCLAVGNKANGVYANHQPGGGDFFNNTAFRNGIDFNMLGRLADNRTDVPGYGHKLRNNLGYKSRARGGEEIAQINREKCDASHDSFDIEGLTLTDKDFVSLDEKPLTQPRQANGDLPAITFMHLAEGSAAIDKGVDIGFPYQGAAPDLGCFEKHK